MMRPLIVQPEPARYSQGSVTRQATLVLSPTEQVKLWYRIPEKHAERITARAEPFAAAAVFLGMSRGQSVHVEGEVAPSFLANLEAFAQVWACWRPESYQPIRLSADQEAAPPTGSNAGGAICTFSGGVDSCYSVLRHQRGLAGRATVPLTAALMIHGIDIPLDQQTAFEQAALRSRRILDSLGVPLLTVATNYRHIAAPPWEDVFAAGLASCLLLFQEQFSLGLIPASFSYHRLVLPYGSNPVTDPWLGANTFPIRHDGAELSRANKIRRLLAWPQAVANLRVCWEGLAKDRNCGRCEKCVRTRLNFRVAGLRNPACFDHDLLDEDIRGLRIKAAQLLAMRNLLRSAQQAGIQESWVTAVEHCIRRNERIETLKQLLPTRLRAYLKRWVSWESSQGRTRAAA